MDNLEIVRQLLEVGDDFLVAGHDHPDGDAIGASVAMAFILKAMGKRFWLYNESGLPEHFSWIELPAPIYSSLADLPSTPLWFIILDCGDPFRMGKELLKAIKPAKIINIDHHMGNPMFGHINWVDTTQAAAGEMAARIAMDLGIPLSGGLAEAVYLSLVADTGQFCYGNTRPETLELAAHIVRQGLNPGDFTGKYQNQWTLNRFKLWSEVLHAATLHHNDLIGVLRIPAALMRETGTTPYDCDGLVEFMRRIKTVRVAMTLREEKKNMIKFSLRSQGPDDVQRVALQFSGGGHRNAAGGSIVGTVEEAQNQLVAAVIESLALESMQRDEVKKLDDAVEECMPRASACNSRSAKPA